MLPENWPSLLRPGLRKVFHLRMQSRESLFKRAQIFNTETSQRAYEEYQGIGELDAEGWSSFEKTGKVGYDQFAPGFLQRLEHREFAKGIQVKRTLMEDNLYPDAGIPSSVNQRVAKLADSAAVQREKSAAELFNNALVDTGTDIDGFPFAGSDGVGLVSAAHPNSPSDKTNVQSNEFELALSGDNVIVVKRAMRKFKDDRGELISVTPDTLIVPPELAETAAIINLSTLDPTSANNAVNVNKGRWNIIEWDYLTDSNLWFMVDSVLKSQHLVWLDRVAPEFESESDGDTMTAKFRGYYRYSRGYDDWRWLAGSNPS